MDTCTKNLEKFVELDQCHELIKDLIDNIPDEANTPKSLSEIERLVETFAKTIDKYQEQPELLEPYVAEIIVRLTTSIVGIRRSSIKYHTVFKFLYQLIKVIGFKSIGKRFPHETDKLPLLVDLLSKENFEDTSNWQTRYALTVWLSIVVLTPFDLAKFDSDTSKESTADKIYAILLRNLNNHDSCQHVTAFCLAKFFSRPDMLKEESQRLARFIDEGLDELAKVETDKLNDFKLIGHLRTLAYMFKLLPRHELKKYSRQILDVVSSLNMQKMTRDLINHLIIKLVQRVGLALLPKRIAAWRYKRSSRVLGGQPVESSPPAGAGATATAAPTSQPKSAGQMVDEGHETATDDQEEGEAMAHLECILSVLFVAAQNGQTKIRWSAAKGIARLASRLSRERASDIIDMVLNGFFDSASSSEYAWHGGCLTLAEMSRSGLIMEEKLAQIVGVINEAIIYDKIKGSFAVGAHVREAACYVLWAFTRTYDDQLLQPHISSISINLLCTMLFDRELQCRRAASATFQELVGRQGTFNEESISILTQVDYQSVGVRQSAYLELALQVAKHGRQYYEPFIGHLLDKKIGHWDIQIRRLASDSLCALMLYPSHEYIRTTVLSRLCQMSEQNLDNNAKHGAMLALAKCLRSLVPLGFEFEPELVEFVGSIGRLCEKQLKSKQQAPNFMEAISNIMLSAEQAKFVYAEDSDTIKLWESIVLATLDSDSGQLRDVGSDGLLTLYRYYYKDNKTCQDRLLTLLNRSLASPNESTRCGGLRSLAKLGRAISSASFANLQPLGGESSIRYDADTTDIIFMSLTSYVARDTKETPAKPATASGGVKSSGAGGNAATDSSLIFAQAKAESCEALAQFIKSLDKNRLVLSLKWLQVSFDALLAKTEDYTFDKRGDIGVVVRRAAIRALTDLTLFLQSIGLKNSLLLDGDRLASLFGRVLQQAVSYNDSAREQASLAFYRLVSQANLPEELVPHYKEILQLLEKHQVNDEFNWRDDSTPIFVCLLEKPEYTGDLWKGLLRSVGQVSDVGAKQFRDSLQDYIVRLEAERPHQLGAVFESFLQTLENKELSQRLLTSGLITADYLLTQGLMGGTDVDFQQRLMQFCWNSRLQNDPKRLASISRVLCSMLQFSSGPIQVECLKCLVGGLLASGYAAVRAYTAEQLYSSLMTYQADLEENLRAREPAKGVAEQSAEVTPSSVGSEPASAISYHSSASSNQAAVPQEPQREEVEAEAAAAEERHLGADQRQGKQLDVEGAMDLLSQTNWSEPLEKVKPIRDKISTCLLLQ